MKTIILLILLVALDCNNNFAQTVDHINKQRQDLRINPQEQIQGDEDKTADKLNLGNIDVPIRTHNGQKPNERQIETIKSTFVDDFLVNDDAGIEDQSVPVIAMDGAGNFVIVWYDFRNDNWDIFYQRYTSAGMALGVNTKVNDDTESATQVSPSISMDVTGNFVIEWSDDRNDNFDIYFQRFTSIGAALGVNTRVTDDIDSTKQWASSISMDGAGNFVIAWIDERNVDRDIYFQRFTSTGEAEGVNTKVNDDAGSAMQVSPSISMDVTGDFSIVWQDFRDDNWNIFSQRYTSTGITVGINTKVSDDVGCQFPSISSMDAAGNRVIVWQDYRNANWDIYYQRITSTGMALGVNTKVNDDAGSAYQKIPKVSVNGVGDFVIVWYDERYGQSGYPDIMAQRYFSNGYPNGVNYRIVAEAPNTSETSPVVYANYSDIIFAWQDKRRSKGWDIYAKIVSWNWSGITDVEINDNNMLTEFSLSQNYPNPFNPSTTIKYTIPNIGNENIRSVQLKIYDVLGREVATLVNKQQSPSNYQVEWNAANNPSGVYFYRLQAGQFIESKKMVLIK